MRDAIRLSLIKDGNAPDAGESTTAPSDATFHDEKRPLLLVSASGQVLNANPAVALLLGYDVEILKTKPLVDVLLGINASVLATVFKLTQYARPVIIDTLCVRSNGSWLSCEVIVPKQEPTSSTGDKLWLWLNASQKVGEQVGRPSQGPHLAKTNEMAEMVAGQVAHDFNNLLTPLLAYPELIRHEVGGNAVVCEYLDVIEKTAHDMSRLTQQLLAMARRGHSGSEAVNLNEMIEQFVLGLQTSKPTGIEIKVELEASPLSVVGNKDQMKRVLENLVENAIEAMGTAGVLSLRTENVYIDTPEGAYSALNVGEYVKLTVSDTGGGIPDEIRDRIFDPFFTTRKAAKKRGAGLGLTIVNGIVHDHRGYIDVSSAPGAGASFYVYFPIARNAEQKSGIRNLPGGVERIMVVDDDLPQVQVLVSILESLGYKATGVTSGEECVSLIRDEGRRYDLLVLDMVMDPGMDGLETFLEVRKTVPSQRAILISGHSKTPHRIAKAQERGAGAYLRKPIAIESLAKVVRDELDRQPAHPSTPSSAKHKILIVDDDPMIRRLFAMIIQGEFPEAMITMTANGDEALGVFEKDRHDLIVMDLQMPVRNGREAYLNIERLCRERNWPLPRIAFCTGFTPPTSMQAIIHGNSRHCLLRKPVNADTLLDAIRTLLKE